MQILLIGKDGQLGEELYPLLSSIANVTAVGREQCDLANPETIRQVIDQTQPEVIVNAAAYTAVDKAESEADLATAINGTAPGILATAAQNLGAKLIHVSTDYVFNGEKIPPIWKPILQTPWDSMVSLNWQGNRLFKRPMLIL